MLGLTSIVIGAALNVCGVLGDEMKIVFSDTSSESEKDIKEFWVNNLVNSMFRGRLEKELEEKQKSCVVADESSLFPYRFTIHAPQENTPQVLQALSSEIDKIKSDGFAEEELSEGKSEWKDWLSELANQQGKAGSFCMQDSFCAVEAVSVKDTQQYAALFLPDVKIPGLLLESKTLDARGTQTDAKHQFVSFYSLPLEEWEKKIIDKILTTLAENNVLRLAFKKKSLEKKGKQINHVHPLRFIAFAFSTVHLKYCMQQVRKSGFKWDGFIDGLSGRMNEEADNKNLMPHIAGFSEYLQVNPDQVRSYIEDRDWEGLVRFLLRLT